MLSIAEWTDRALALSSLMKLTSSASFSPSIRISLRLKIHQAQAKNFCRVLDIRVSQIVDSDDFDACCLASELHATFQGIFGQRKNTAVRFQSVKLLEVVLYLVAEEVRHLDYAITFLRFRRGDNVLTL